MTTTTMPDTTFGTFFLPGPTEVRPEVLQAMTRPMIAHRGREFEAMFARIQEGLREVFGTARPVFVSSSSATGLMEAAVRGVPQGPILSVVNGAFSERFAQIVRQTDRELDVLDVEPGQVATPDEVAARLRARRYTAMTVVHSETSTGALHDVRAIRAVAAEAGVPCLVDSVTGVGGAELRFDDWSLDLALTGSQKALAMPPGLAFAVASEGYMANVTRASARGLYFDLAEFEEYVKKNQTPNTPATSLLYAAEVQLAHLRAETMPARWARHAAMAAQTHRWVDERAARFGIGILAPAGHRSPTVTAVTVPDGITGDDIVRAVKARGFTLGSGYGTVKTRTFRVGHMGDHTPDRLAACLDATEDALAELLGR
ncbi:pyridoxal-phosphate-dependent aminotransferase family protein [Roseisolibacter agri]|uniref:Aminotransferase n=1 Tax=Roseisolibacter agri TaxID=2014610 RepID=A0AA37PZQ2_9BACT|nr:alanine--glyoxylate aminotransferase family protein [Roseisolibacter agri]GLC23694.1 aminotransferase [Roseisolibacter agri]